jgi:hypothetical protein
MKNSIRRVMLAAVVLGLLAATAGWATARTIVNFDFRPNWTYKQTCTV